jgi:2-polyprenyl-6-methoxyphenol hydroxylase-like FAD-dependent oxidoreductase
MLDVAIAGGGPGGLACAHALRRAMPHVSVKVGLTLQGISYCTRLR